jgi:hypothetical protein
MKAVPRSWDDMQALLALSELDEPPLRRVLCQKRYTAYYGLGNASGAGFGAMLQKGKSIYYNLLQVQPMDHGSKGVGVVKLA